MARLDKVKYQAELVRVAKNLGLKSLGDVEVAIIDHCKAQMDAWVSMHGQPKTLTNLLDQYGASLDMTFIEIHSEADLHTLLKDIPPTKEPVMARIRTELDDSTDADHIPIKV
jgi:hypothetical protein